MSALSYIVFLVLDLLDFVLCLVYGTIDWFIEGKASPCYCQIQETTTAGEEISETLYRRRNVFRENLGFLRSVLLFSGKCERGGDCGGMGGGARWSDCGCESCVSWTKQTSRKLFVSILGPSQEPETEGRSSEKREHENVLFLHGFLSSSSVWTETVFPNLSESIKRSHKLFAVDLLGFGKSPKPRNCLYTLRDHLEMIEKSVICAYELDHFHLVAHSMGCIPAIALAVKYPNSVRSITLVAPPFFPSKDCENLKVLEKLAAKKLWPPSLFGSAVMSWYEHISRSVCFLICRNHRALEKILKLFTRKRDLHFMFTDLTRHSHNSAWLSMHNVICGGSKLMESHVKSLTERGVKIYVVQGDRDEVVPVECSENFGRVASSARVDLVRGADHISVILGREKEFTRYLEHIWTH